MNLLNRIKALCAGKGVTQRKMETDLGLGNGTSSKWSRASPSGEVLHNVAQYFNVTMDYLLGSAPFKNDNEALTSIGITSAKYVMLNRDEFDPKFADENVMKLYKPLHNTDCDLYDYVDTLVCKFQNKSSNINNIEFFELFNILFKDIKYNKKTYDGLIHITDFFGITAKIHLDLYNIPKLSNNDINYHKSPLYKIMTHMENGYTIHTSLLNTMYVRSQHQEMMTLLPRGVELTEEEQSQINHYTQFILSKRNNK